MMEWVDTIAMVLATILTLAVLVVCAAELEEGN